MTGRWPGGHLRTEADADARRRRAVVGLSVASMAAMGVISAYQLGFVRRLPDPPGFDSEAVVGSRRAYRYFGVPDGLLGLGSYAATAVLAAAGGNDRARRRPLLSLTFAGKVLFDLLNALKLTWDEWAKEKAWCSYCLLATACTLGAVPLVWPEAREALGTLQASSNGRRSHAL